MLLFAFKVLLPLSPFLFSMFSIVYLCILKLIHCHFSDVLGDCRQKSFEFSLSFFFNWKLPFNFQVYNFFVILSQIYCITILAL